MRLVRGTNHDHSLGRGGRLSKPPTKAERFLRHLEPLQASLEAFCRRSLRDQAAVEDVLQNTVAKTFRDFDLYAEGTNFRAWIFRYLNFEIYAGNRQLARHGRQPLVQDPAVEETLELAIEEPLLESLLERSEEVLDHCDQTLAQAVWGRAWPAWLCWCSCGVSVRRSSSCWPFRWRSSPP